MGKLDGRVAFVTGAARGQGRSHALAQAAEGADIIALDICEQVASVPHAMATPTDLAETVALVEALDRRIVAAQVDVRDLESMDAFVTAAVGSLGRLDIVVANAGIMSYARAKDLPDQAWKDVIDIDLTGVWHTTKVATPHLISGGRGGSIIITSSQGGLKGVLHGAHHVAASTG